MNTKDDIEWKQSNCYFELKSEYKYIFNLIEKYHDYFSKQDKKYRRIVKN